jgi:hypothetical protein
VKGLRLLFFVLNLLIGPAPEHVTDAIYKETLELKEYNIADIPDVPFPIFFIS